LVVVTSPNFAPGKFARQFKGGIKEFRYGKGKWIVTDDMAGEKLKKAIEPFLGKEDEIVCRFKGNRKVIMIISPDGKELQVVKNELSDKKEIYRSIFVPHRIEPKTTD